ncbi:MAG: hypothetical protein GY725_20080 [bacterium]|nr:hypothetical protein [bacterium]
MTDDRYAPPDAPLVDESALFGEGDGEFDISQALSDAWNATWANFPLWLGVGLVGGVLIALSAFIPPVLGLFLIAPVIVWGMVRFTLNMMDRKAQFGDLFAGFSNYGSSLLSTLVLFISIFFASWIGQIVQTAGIIIQNSVLEAIGTLFSFVWALFVISRLNFGVFFIVDRGLGPIEALQASWNITRGRSVRVAGLLVIQWILLIAGFFALVIGVIPAATIGYLMWASAYRQMVGRPTV